MLSIPISKTKFACTVPIYGIAIPNSYRKKVFIRVIAQ